jgi:hypothetical protein
MASVQNETAEGLQHIGRAFFKLDESMFPEMSTRDLWLPLDQQGRILIRISREEEKSDPQYYFGKAFWSLRRIETDMVHICVDKVSSLQASLRLIDSDMMLCRRCCLS